MSRREASWPALDVLRGIAAVGMVANHAAVRLCGSVDAHWASSAAFLLGGLAPVLFFFATGFGTGVQHAAAAAGGAEAHRYGLWRKVLVLLAADQFERWRTSAGGLGVDFLAFIGLSMLVLEPLRHARRGVAFAAALLVAVLGVRFALSPALAALGLDSAALGAVTGRTGVHWLSYPPLPWLAFPLLGFVLGALGEWRRDLSRAGLLAAACIALGALGWAASTGLAQLGLRVNRYGTMSLAYLPFALAGIAFAAAAALAIERWGAGRVARALALRGLPSLLLVPVHFWLLATLRSGLAPAGAAIVLAALAVAVALSLALSRAIAEGAARLAASPFAPGAGAACAAYGALAAAAANFAAIPKGTGRTALVFSGQMAVCLLLVLPLAKPREARLPDVLPGAHG